MAQNPLSVALGSGPVALAELWRRESPHTPRTTFNNRVKALPGVEVYLASDGKRYVRLVAS